MDNITSKDIGIPFIISLMVNLISGYLFSIKIINLTLFLSILIGSLIVIILIGVQLKTNEIKEKASNIEKELIGLKKEYEERFKIYDRLNNIERKIDSLDKKRR